MHAICFGLLTFEFSFTVHSTMVSCTIRQWFFMASHQFLMSTGCTKESLESKNLKEVSDG